MTAHFVQCLQYRMLRLVHLWWWGVKQLKNARLGEPKRTTKGIQRELRCSDVHLDLSSPSSVRLPAYVMQLFVNQNKARSAACVFRRTVLTLLNTAATRTSRYRGHTDAETASVFATMQNNQGQKKGNRSVCFEVCVCFCLTRIGFFYADYNRRLN